MASFGFQRVLAADGPSDCGAASSVRGSVATALLLDVALVAALVDELFTGQVILGFHIVFLLLTVAALTLEARAFAIRVLVYQSLAAAILLRSVRAGETPAEELVELPILTAVTLLVFLVAQRRGRVLLELERTQALLETRRAAERRELERELEQTQKLDAVGRLTLGIAHDFSNVLTAVLGYTEQLLEELDDSKRRHAEEIDVAVRRGAALVSDLMAFVRPQLVEPAVIDVNDIVSSLCGLLRPLIGEDVRLELHLDGEPAMVKINRSRLERVIVNLAINARDAMPSGGTLSVKVARAPLRREVSITVRDTGVGMDETTMRRMFEPFFTTKSNGHSAGFGLANVQSIVTEYGGSIETSSQPGTGSSFRLSFPEVETGASTTTPSAEQAAERGSETIVLVEDDAAVCALAEDVLRRHGYIVITAANGELAMTKAEDFHHSIDLLLTDIVLPGMNGVEIATALRRWCPRLRVLFTSGYSSWAVAQVVASGEPVDILAKPFSPSALLGRVRSVLDHQCVGERMTDTPVPARLRH